MDDNMIVKLYWDRDETAIAATKEKYGRYCHSIAYNVLHNAEDAEECVNDTYLGAWNSMPPNKPQVLGAFLGRITRNISLKKWRYMHADKRGGGEVAGAIEELEQCVASNDNVEKEIELKELSKIIDTFLRELPVFDRNIFICRYWYFDSIADICKQFECGESKVKMKLMRTRGKLMTRLQKEGVKL